MRDLGIIVPRGKIATTPDEAFQAAKIFREWSGDGTTKERLVIVYSLFIF